jgi:hypothetical protein
MGVHTCKTDDGNKTDATALGRSAARTAGVPRNHDPALRHFPRQRHARRTCASVYQQAYLRVIRSHYGGEDKGLATTHWHDGDRISSAVRSTGEPAGRRWRLTHGFWTPRDPDAGLVCGEGSLVVNGRAGVIRGLSMRPVHRGRGERGELNLCDPTSAAAVPRQALPFQAFAIPACETTRLTQRRRAVRYLSRGYGAIAQQLPPPSRRYSRPASQVVPLLPHWS